MPGTMWTRRCGCWAATTRATTSKQALRSIRSVLCFLSKLNKDGIPVLHCVTDISLPVSLTAAAHGRSDAPADASTKPPHHARLLDTTWTGNQWPHGTGHSTVNTTVTLPWRVMTQAAKFRTTFIQLFGTQLSCFFMSWGEGVIILTF